MTEREIQKQLQKFLMERGSCFCIPNTFVPSYPWESDLVLVKRSLHWSEFEIKISRSDYKQDFKKCAGVNKHDFLRGSQGRMKPSQFYFVFPRGLVQDNEVPRHCGIVEYNPESRRDFGITIIRKAPVLKSARKLNEKMLFSLGIKMGWRLV